MAAGAACERVITFVAAESIVTFIAPQSVILFAPLYEVIALTAQNGVIICRRSQKFLL